LCQWLREARWTPGRLARSHFIADTNSSVAEQLRICFRDGEPQLLLNVLLGGGRCVGVTVELYVFVAFSFDAHRRHYTKRAEVPCG